MRARMTPRMPIVKGLASIECPGCGRVLRDYDVPVNWHSLVRVGARCHTCRVRHTFEIDTWRGETNVWCVGSVPWEERR